VRFDLKTPGRGALEPATPGAQPAPAGGAAWLAALGGAANISSVAACTTRLRLEVVSHSAVDAEQLRQLGARGLVRPTVRTLQVVVGTVADQLAGEIRAALPAAAAPAAGALAASSAPIAAAAVWHGQPGAALAALGGAANVQRLDVAASRVLVRVHDDARIDPAKLKRAGVRAVARPAAGCVHLIVGPSAQAAAAALQGLLGAGSRGP
jgi:PTS system N-acetylglucosamine-specific IIC component